VKLFCSQEHIIKSLKRWMMMMIIIAITIVLSCVSDVCYLSTVTVLTMLNKRCRPYLGYLQFGHSLIM